MPSAIAALAGAVSMALAAGCADFAGSFDPAHGLPDAIVSNPDFSRDIEPIFERRCATGGCHSAQTRQAGLDLTRGGAYASLVDVPSSLRPGEIRVRRGDAAGSWLMIMLGDESARRGSINRMPLASAPLTPNQLATIANWIDRGARPD